MTALATATVSIAQPARGAITARSCRVSAVRPGVDARPARCKSTRVDYRRRHDALFADSPKITGSGRLPVGRHVQPDFAGENGGVAFGLVGALAGRADRVDRQGYAIREQAHALAVRKPMDENPQCLLLGADGAHRKPVLLLRFRQGASQPLFPASLRLHRQ
jgi:hypothetical protein